MVYLRAAAVLVSLGLITLLFFSFQGFDSSRFPPIAVERFIYKQHSTKIIVSKRRIGKSKDQELKDTEGKRKKKKETCDVNPAPRGVYVKGHGPCITQFPRTIFNI